MGEECVCVRGVCGMVEGSQEYNESIVLRLHQVCVWGGGGGGSVCVGRGVCGMVEGSQEYNESIVLRLHQVCVWVGVCVGWRGGCV